MYQEENFDQHVQQRQELEMPQPDYDQKLARMKELEEAMERQRLEEE